MGVSSGKEEAQPELQASSAGRGAGATGNDTGSLRSGNVVSVDAQAAAATEAAVAGDSDPGERAASGGTVANLPHVADSSKVVSLQEFATRGKSKGRKVPVKSTSNRATRGKLSDRPPKVEAVKNSKGTWAFRLRWNSLPGRPVAYVTFVSDAVYELIKSGDYDAFKEQLITNYNAKALRANHGA